MAFDLQKDYVGYRGSCKIGETYVLCTGGSINLTQDPIMGSGVWGAAPEKVSPIAYAWNYFNLEGSANFQVTTNVVSPIKSWVKAGRSAEQQITLVPGKDGGYNGAAYCTGLTFDASEGAAVNGGVNFKGKPSGYSGGTSSNNAALFAGQTLVPYWNTTFNSLPDVISWSFSYNSDVQVVAFCKKGNAPIDPDYVLLGDMTGDANVSIFAKEGSITGAEHSEITNLTIQIANDSLTIPKAILTSQSQSMATGAQYIAVEKTYQLLGDGQADFFS